MTNIKESVQRARHALGKGAETVFTSLFCSAVIIFPSGKSIDTPDILHAANNDQKPFPLDGVVYFPDGITVQTAIGRVPTGIKDFRRGRDHDGRGEINYGGRRFILTPDVPVTIDTGGVRAMYTKKQPDEITRADLARLKDSQVRR